MAVLMERKSGWTIAHHSKRTNGFRTFFSEWGGRNVHRLGRPCRPLSPDRHPRHGPVHPRVSVAADPTWGRSFNDDVSQ